jgi:hypothetical protein
LLGGSQQLPACKGSCRQLLVHAHAHAHAHGCLVRQKLGLEQSFLSCGVIKSTGEMQTWHVWSGTCMRDRAAGLLVIMVGTSAASLKLGLQVRPHAHGTNIIMWSCLFTYTMVLSVHSICLWIPTHARFGPAGHVTAGTGLLSTLQQHSRVV